MASVSRGINTTAFAYVLLWLVSLAASQTVNGVPFPRLIDVTLDDLAEGLEGGLFTSVDLVKTYLARIEQVNSTLHAVVEVNPDALDIAESLDKQRANGTIRGPLHGIPILIKNNIATMDKMNNTAGSWALLGATVPRDSTVVKKLREAGAIILGKTNLSQWMNFRTSFTGNSSNGWSAHGGQTYAAYYPQQDPSGSSSGSGVSADLGLAFAALGSETDGSIVSPSQRNNLVGIKPTVGLTSRSLVVPISQHQDTVGPMARTVKDAAHLLQAIAGKDAHDNYTSVIPFIPDYAAACDMYALRGVRIGVPWNVIELSAVEEYEVETEAFYKAIEVMKSAGAVIVEANFTKAEEKLQSNVSLIAINADFLTDIASYLAELTSNPNEVHDLVDVRKFTREFHLEEYPDRDTGVWDTVLDQGFDNTDPRFWAAYQESLRLTGPGGLFGALDRHNLTAVILPTSMSSSWAAGIGAPIVTVPMGHYPATAPVTMNDRGDLVNTGPRVPYGLSFLGRRWAEAQLIGLAYGFEQRTEVRGRVQPYVVPNAEIGDYAGH